MDIDQFQKQLGPHNDYARNNLYDVKVYPPPNLTFYSGYDKADKEHLSMMIKAASIPAKSLGTLDTKRFGAIFKVANDVMVEGVTFTVMCSKYNEEHKFFEGWMSAIYNYGVQDDSSAIYRMKYYKEYVGSVTVQTITRDGKNGPKVYLHEAYPTNVGAIELQYGDGDIATFTVTLSFRDWHYISG